jgi:hypothetical protein
MSLLLAMTSQAQEIEDKMSIMQKTAQSRIQAWQDSTKSFKPQINALASDIQTIQTGATLRQAALLVPESTQLPGIRALESTGEPSWYRRVDIQLQPSSKLLIENNEGTRGVVLTGEYLIEYARFILLVPKYQELQKQHQKMISAQDSIITNYAALVQSKDLQIIVKDETIKLLNERNQLNENLLDVYRPGFFDKLWDQTKFPLGITIGVIAGVIAAK